MNHKSMLTALMLCLVTPILAASPQAVAAPAAAGAAVHNDPDAFDPYKPGVYLDGKLFHVPAGASFAWQAWESPKQRIGDILVNDLAEQSWVTIEQVELAHPSEEPDSLVLNQYTLTVHADVPADTILNVKTSGGNETADDKAWAFGFTMHIVPADKYMMLLKKLSLI